MIASARCGTIGRHAAFPTYYLQRLSGKETQMSDVVYESRVVIRRLGGKLRAASLPAESEPVLFGVHGAIAEHYGVGAGDFEPHATTIDYVVAATGG